MSAQQTALLQLLMPGLIAFVIALVGYPFYIRWLKAKQIGQYIREEGPQSHAAKAKTPTMGGLLFIAITTVVSLAFLINLFASDMHKFGASQSMADVRSPFVISLAVVLIGALCGLVGFVDDYGKVTSKSNRGLSAKTRLIVEFGLGFVLGVLILVFNKSGAPIVLGPLPELQASVSELGQAANIIYLLAFTPFLVAATTNAINLHDGMDGLAAGTSSQVFAVLSIMLFTSALAAATPLPVQNMYLGIIGVTVTGALLGFLVYNKNPAKLFMGDTGSLYIGGLMASLVIAGGLTLWFIPLALIYIVETVSVMLQVVYFKLTKEYKPETAMSSTKLVWTKLTKRLPGEGERLFRMAPLHHHFEAVGADKGIPEWQVVAGFWLVQLVTCLLVTWQFISLSNLRSVGGP